MKFELTDERNYHVFLEQRGEYRYTIKPFEITNTLGAVIAVLKEYTVTNPGGENYKLYRTKEGNWYDIPGTNSGVDSARLRALKCAIDYQENAMHHQADR